MPMRIAGGIAGGEALKYAMTVGSFEVTDKSFATTKKSCKMIDVSCVATCAEARILTRLLAICKSFAMIAKS